VCPASIGRARSAVEGFSWSPPGRERVKNRTEGADVTGLRQAGRASSREPTDRSRAVTDAQQVLDVLRPMLDPSAGPLDVDTALLSTGIIDSLGLQEAVDALVEAFGAQLDVDDLGVDNADTARQIATLVDASR
jgi:acyl carrier protein